MISLKEVGDCAHLLTLSWAPHFHVLSFRVRTRVRKIWLSYVMGNITIIDTTSRGFENESFAVFWAGTGCGGQTVRAVSAQTVEPMVGATALSLRVCLAAARLTGRSGRWHIILSELHNNAVADRLIKANTPPRMAYLHTKHMPKFHGQGLREAER